ncbi:hypothetical protein, partial [Eisenbergiella tayi]|uniref:hypothetical protein n=1 Tax=Eisenbergiella tayi TaxID=1432052 RepID=UPI001C272A07
PVLRLRILQLSTAACLSERKRARTGTLQISGPRRTAGSGKPDRRLRKTGMELPEDGGGYFI